MTTIQRPRVVYIAHPVSGNVDENIKNIFNICSMIHSPHLIPFAPYLVGLQYLNDQLIEQRELGMQVNAITFRKRVMDETGLFGPKISSGMTGEIELSIEETIPLRCYNPKLEIPLFELAEEKKFNIARLEHLILPKPTLVLPAYLR